MGQGIQPCTVLATGSRNTDLMQFCVCMRGRYMFFSLTQFGFLAIDSVKFIVAWWPGHSFQGGTWYNMLTHTRTYPPPMQAHFAQATTPESFALIFSLWGVCNVGVCVSLGGVQRRRMCGCATLAYAVFCFSRS